MQIYIFMDVIKKIRKRLWRVFYFRRFMYILDIFVYYVGVLYITCILCIFARLNFAFCTYEIDKYFLF